MHASVLAQVVIRVVSTVITARVYQACTDLALVFRNQLVKLEVDSKRAFLFRHCGLILHSWEEQAIFGQVTEDVSLRMLRRVNYQALLV